MYTTSKRILVLGCGGRISTPPNNALSKERQVATFETFLNGEIVPVHANKGLQVDFVSMAQEIDGANLNPHHWEAISDHIRKSRFEYDGFFILHPRVNSVEAANHIAYSTLGNTKPIVFLESDMSYLIPWSNATRTLHAGINVSLGAAKAIPGVTIYTRDHKFVSAFDAKYGCERGANDLSIFSRSGNIFAELHAEGVSTFLSGDLSQNFRSMTSSAFFGPRNVCDPNLQIMTLDYSTPLPNNFNNRVIRENTEQLDGVVLLTHSGRFKDSYTVYSMLEDFAIPCVVVDVLGKNDTTPYVSPFEFMPHIISGGTMSREAASAKLRFGLSQGFTGEELRTWMQTPYLNDHPDSSDMVFVDDRGYRPQASRGLITLEAA